MDELGLLASNTTNLNTPKVLPMQYNTYTKSERPGIMREGALVPKGFDLQPKVTDLNFPHVVIIRHRYTNTRRRQYKGETQAK